jgi:hypothetical protein
VAVLSGGAAGAVASQLLAIHGERSARIRNEKIAAFKGVLEANEAARAALTDLRHELENWEKVVGQAGSGHKKARTPDVGELAERADRADKEGHDAIRRGRLRLIEMTMMFAPNADLERAAWRQRETFRELREALHDVRATLAAASPGSSIDHKALWVTVNQRRDARRAAERDLIGRVHPALWPWWQRRAGPRPDQPRLD